MNVIRRALGPESVARVSRICRRSIVWARTHRDVLIAALSGKSPLEPSGLDRYLAMYANADTETMAADVLQGMTKLFAEAAKRGLIDASKAVIELSP